MPDLAQLPAELKPRVPTLTAPQNLFCALIAKGWKKGEAWKRANPETSQGKQGCSVAASRLLRKPAIQARIAEESAALTSNPVITGCLERDQKRLILAGWVRDESLPHETRLAALREDSALAGHNAPKVSVALSPTLSVAKELLERYTQRAPQPERIALPDTQPLPSPSASLPQLTASPLQEPATRRQGDTPQTGSDVASPHKTFADISRTLSSPSPVEVDVAATPATLTSGGQAEGSGAG